MCIAILNKSGVLSNKALNMASNNNPDGAGMMYARDGKVHIFKSLKNKEVIAEYKKFREDNHITPVVLHFRIATDGGITTDNCHPYRVNDDTALVHNGILSNYSNQKTNMSDTRLFIVDILSKIDNSVLFTDYMNKLIGQAIDYNKLIVLNESGLYMIVNEFLGHWDDGKTNWFSNDSYKPAKPVVYKAKGSSVYNSRAWQKALPTTYPKSHADVLTEYNSSGFSYCVSCGCQIWGADANKGKCNWCQDFDYEGK